MLFEEEYMKTETLDLPIQGYLMEETGGIKLDRKSNKTQKKYDNKKDILCSTIDLPFHLIYIVEKRIDSLLNVVEEDFEVYLE